MTKAVKRLKDRGTTKGRRAESERDLGDVLVARIRMLLSGRGALEKRMFGGISFMLNGNMFIGVTNKRQLMVRVGPDRYEWALGRAHIEPMTFTGRPLRGFVYVAPKGFQRDSDLARWIEEGAAFALVTKPMRKRARPA